MSLQLNLRLTLNTTSLPGLEDGPMRLGSQDGLTTDRSPQEAAHVSLIPRQARAKGLLTSGTCGPRSFGTSNSYALQSSLVSKLHQRLPLTGGILWHLIWSQRTTPQQRLIYHLRALEPHTVDKGCSGWLTPTVQDSNGRTYHNQRDGSIRLSMLGQTRVAWPTPRASREGREKIDVMLKGVRASGAPVPVGLASAVQLAVWNTPTVNDSKNNGSALRCAEKR